MKEPVGARLPGLDTLRAIAIVAVMLYHLQWALPAVFLPVGQFCWMGVDLFFVLSGYLIGGQLLKPYARGKRPSLADFYRRRAYRILPAYLVVLALYFVWPLWRESKGISPLWEFLTFTENFFVDYGVNQAFSHVWSLCVEEHFYLVLPMLAMAMMRRPSLRKTVWVMCGFVLMGMAIRWFVQAHELAAMDRDDRGVAYIEHIYYPTWARLDGLLAGVALALVRIFRPVWWSAAMRRGHGLLAGGLVLTGVSLWLFKDRVESVTGVAGWGTVVGFPLLSVGFGLLVASSVSVNGWLSRLRVPGARLVATLAFSLYLTHKEIAHLDRVFLKPLVQGRDAKATVVYAVTCLVGAGVLYLCVERPAMVLRDRGDRRRIEEEMRTEPAL